MQVLARLMDRVLAGRGAAGDDRRRHVRRYGRRRHRGLPRLRSASTPCILFPNGRVSDVQRRMMTTPTEPNVHAVAIDGTFDDCQALVKAMFNDLGFRDRVKLAGVNSINWARVVAQMTYYFVAAVALGAPHRPVSFSCRPATSATSSPATSPSAWGCRSSGWSSPPTTTTSCRRAHAPAATRCARSSPPRRRRWTSRSPPTSSAICSRHRAATPPGCAPRWARLSQSGRFELGSLARSDATRLCRRRRQRGRGRRMHPRTSAPRAATCRPAYRLRRRRCRARLERQPRAADRAGDRPPGEVPRRHAGDHRRAAAAAPSASTPDDGHGAHHRARPTISAPFERFVEVR